MKTYRQGDVLLIEAEGAIDPAARKVKREDGRIILAHGEATGHAHAIDETDAELWEAPTGRRHLRLVKPAALLHEEHAPISLPSGLYDVRRQREYSPEEIRTVAD